MISDSTLIILLFNKYDKYDDFDAEVIINYYYCSNK